MSSDVTLRNPASEASASTSLDRRITWLGLKERAIQTMLLMCALVSIATTLAITAILISETIDFFRMASVAIAERQQSEMPPGVAAEPIRPSVPRAMWEFVSDTEWTPQYATKHFGILPLLAGTFLVAILSSLIGVPVGLASAIYLSEYATPRFRSYVKPVLEILAGIPTVVYGYFGLIFVTPILRKIFEDGLGWHVDVFNALSAGIVVAIMIIPTISSLSEDVLRAVPKGLREAAYGLGSTKFDVSVRVVVPAALSGILASFLLAISRAIGETMAVTIAAGQSPVLTLNPLRSIETMTAYIVNVSMGDTRAGSVEYASLYAVAMSLFLITLATNFLAQWIMRRYREVYH